MGLNLNNLAKQVVSLGFSLASDITFAATYVQPTLPTYNADAGTVAPTNQNFSLSAMLTHFSEDQKKGDNYRAGDERILIRAVDLNVQPTEDDYIMDEQQIKRQIIAFTLDATKSLWAFHTRRIITFAVTP